MYGLAYESLPCQQASLTCSDVFPRCDASTPLNMSYMGGRLVSHSNVEMVTDTQKWDAVC